MVFAEESGHMIPNMHMSAAGYHGIAHIEIEESESGKTDTAEPAFGTYTYIDIYRCVCTLYSISN